MFFLIDNALRNMQNASMKNQDFLLYQNQNIKGEKKKLHYIREKRKTANPLRICGPAIQRVQEDSNPRPFGP